MKEPQIQQQPRESYKDGEQYHATDGRVAVTLIGGITLNRTTPPFVTMPNANGAPVDDKQHWLVKLAVPGTPPHALTVGRINRCRCVALFASALNNAAFVRRCCGAGRE